MDTVETEPEGYDVKAVEAWIASNVKGLTPPLTWTRLQGGHSNLTYRINDSEGRAAVIRGLSWRSDPAAQLRGLAKRARPAGSRPLTMSGWTLERRRRSST